MEDIVQGFLAGIALGGFTAAVFKANLLALKALWYANRLATKTAWHMFQGVEREQERRQRVKTILKMPEEVERQQLERERKLLERWRQRQLSESEDENSET